MITPCIIVDAGVFVPLIHTGIKEIIQKLDIMLDNGISQEINRAVLVGLSSRALSRGDNADEASMDELQALLETAGGTCMGTVLQSREAPDPRTFIGEGKVEEVRTLVEATESDMVIFDNELSPSNIRVLTDSLGVQVLDRTALILDIFAQRAHTREGRLQVELAQYQYLLPRLTGMWGHLVRQTAAGGKSPIGTRGPGETQLETDRRHIRRKITKLQDELKEVRRVRSVQRNLREKNEIPVAAIVGYTNAGKSTLLNCLTGSEIPANNRLFDTLDTTTRALALSETCTVLVSDTVGFIRKLPHLLVDAFKATLEELEYADVIIHVVDASSPEWREQIAVVDDLIVQLGVAETPRILVFNKSDLGRPEVMPHGDDILSISAKTGEGIPNLLETLKRHLDNRTKAYKLLLPYEKGGLLDLLYREAKVEQVTYSECIEVQCVLTPRLLGQVRMYCDPPLPEPKEPWED